MPPSLSPTLAFGTLLAALCLTSCGTPPPQQPRIQFDDRPSAYAPSSYRAGETTTRQTVHSDASFYQGNDDAMRRGSEEIAEMRARRAAEAAAYASSSSGSSGSSKGAAPARSFTSSGYNDMKVTYDKMANTAPTRGTNTIGVQLGNVGYSITYDFYPGSYMCHGGDLTGATVSVKFSGGTPISVKNYHGGEGYVVVKSFRRL